MSLSEIPRIVIVGAGLGGTATAVRFLQFAREPVRIVIVERRPEYRNAGVAYHPAGNHWHHVFNIQAGRMSMFREDVDDFVAWANDEADRTGWPPEWRDVAFTESGPAPRRVYADYLAVRLAEAAREAADGVTLEEIDGEVVDLAVRDGGVDVVLADRPEALRAAHVVLATGLEEKELPFAAAVREHPSFVRHAYSAAGVERLQNVRPDATVVIIGSLLSAYDSASLLLRRGHTGTIHLISRSGLTLRTYPRDHRHHVLDLPRPRLHADGYEGRDDFVRLIRDEWRRACDTVAREHPGVAPAVVTERVTKSWEPHLPEVLARVPSSDLRALLDGYGSLIATLRVSAVAYITEFVDAALERGGPLVRTVGGVDEIAATDAGTLRVTVSGADAAQVIDADLVVANFGRETDYERAGSPLWANLLRTGLAVRHRRTGRGVEVDASGVLLGPDGAPSGPITVVGGPREGDEIVRYGRLGAFAFNLAAIKNHSVGTAATVLHRVEHRYDERAGDVADAVAGAADDDVRAAFERAVELDVHRMAARSRADTEELEHRLGASLTVLCDALARAGGPSVPDRAMRYAVNKAAMTRLNDLSVTPRELRRELGLREHAEAE
ncbi:FAD/NAD(P)-binding protein [Actinomadura flavalba]|uniref:FAD/NAD(P)-binding protein n=1 Tax=Actinomadura flavalba TaxID=1120938 RepID=UPI00037EE165|nr:FAD/NAD(P)-binding protein [Actinomadura flavalba]